MASPWKLVHPRLAFWLTAGKPLRLIGILLTVALTLAVMSVAVFGALFALGHYGFGPLVAMATKDSEWMSVALGGAVSAVFAWLLWASVKKQIRDVAAEIPAVEGRLEEVTEIDEYHEYGRGHCLSVQIRGKEYLLPHRLKKILKNGALVRIALWAGSEDVRAVWLAQ